jgi:hypothetical protein
VPGDALLRPERRSRVHPALLLLGPVVVVLDRLDAVGDRAMGAAAVLPG